MPVDQLSGLVDEGRGETVGIGLVVGQLGVDVVEDVPLLEGSQSRSDGPGTEGRLTMFSKVVGRPKVKSLSLPKKWLASSAFFLNSSELYTFWMCFSKACRSEFSVIHPFDLRSAASTYRAFSPALQREIVVRFNGFNCGKKHERRR
jgi:hypothetical protein